MRPKVCAMPTLEERMCNALRALDAGTYNGDDRFAITECLERKYLDFAADAAFTGPDTPRTYSGSITESGRKFLADNPN